MCVALGKRNKVDARQYAAWRIPLKIGLGQSAVRHCARLYARTVTIGFSRPALFEEP